MVKKKKVYIIVLTFWLMVDVISCTQCDKVLKNGAKLKSKTCIECDTNISKACQECCDWFEYAHDHLGH